MRKLMTACGIAALACACSGGAPEQNNVAETPTTLAAGQYKADWTVAQLRSVDKTTPATNLKEKTTGSTTACVADDGAVDPKLFAEDGDECTIGTSYMRNGRINMDVTCTRKGQSGEIRQTVTGSYTAQGLQAEASTTTYLSGAGDYSMVRTFTGKRVGECPPAIAADTPGNSAG